jgi:hypothetical protein
MRHAVVVRSSAGRRVLGGAILLLIALGLAVLGFAADTMLTAMIATAAEAPQSRTLAGPDVAVFTLCGAVRVEAGAGSSVEAEITTAGRDAARLRIETGEIEGRNTLRVVFPGSRVVYPAIGRGSNLQLRYRDDGTFGDGFGKSFFGGRLVRVTGSGSGLEAHADLRVRVPAGKSAAIYVGAGRIDATNVDGDIRLDAASAPVSASRMRGTLVIDTGSGSVSLSESAGDLSVDTGSGSVELSGIAGDALRVDTGSGSVTGTDIAVERLSVDTGSGGIDMDTVKADDLVLDTGSGSVRLDLVSQADRLAVDTGSGDVDIEVPNGFGATLSIETGSGDISTNLQLTGVRRSSGELHARAGDGRCAMRLETGSGSIRVSESERRSMR